MTGNALTRFWPPYGALSPEVLAVLEKHPTTLTLWDRRGRLRLVAAGPERIAATVLGGRRAGLGGADARGKRVIAARPYGPCRRSSRACSNAAWNWSRWGSCRRLVGAEDKQPLDQ